MHPSPPAICRICLIFAVALWAAAITDFSCARLAAQQPPKSPGYVLLRNGNVLRGDAKQDGAFVSVEEANVAAVRLPQADVLCWAPRLEDLYAYRLQHRKPHSLTARFEDLRWCIKQGLLEIADSELSQLQKLAPSDRRVVSMAALLRSAQRRQEVDAELAHEPDSGPPPAGSEPDALSDSDIPAGEPRRPDLLGSLQADPLGGRPVVVQDTEAEVAALPRELVVTYTKRIQPLLINRCGQAGCHGGASMAVWQLEHFGSSNRLPASFTRQNLGGLLQWIHHEQADASPLMVRATEPHGGRETAPLSPREEDLQQSLRGWITAMVQRHTAARGGAFASTPAGDPMFAATASHEDSLAPNRPGTGPASKPTRLPLVEDPFDPADFNRIYHAH